MRQKKPSRKYTLLTLCFLIAIMGMQRHSMLEDTLWYCDLTSEAPNSNGIKNSTDTVEIAVKVRTNLEKTCSSVSQVGESLSVNDMMIAGTITKCLPWTWIGRTQDAVKVIDESKSGIEKLLIISGRL